MKTADPTVVSEPGTEVVYDYVVTNTGDVTLTGIEVNDDKLGVITMLEDELAPGATTTGTATYEVTETDIDAGDDIVNEATVTTDQDVTDTDTATVEIEEPEPEFSGTEHQPLAFLSSDLKLLILSDEVEEDAIGNDGTLTVSAGTDSYINISNDLAAGTWCADFETEILEGDYVYWKFEPVNDLDALLDFVDDMDNNRRDFFGDIPWEKIERIIDEFSAGETYNDQTIEMMDIQVAIWTYTNGVDHTETIEGPRIDQPYEPDVDFSVDAVEYILDQVDNNN